MDPEAPASRSRSYCRDGPPQPGGGGRQGGRPQPTAFRSAAAPRETSRMSPNGLPDRSTGMPRATRPPRGPRGEAGVAQHAERGATRRHGPAIRSTVSPSARAGGGADEDRDVERRCRCRCHAEQGGVGRRVAEERHAAPDDEAAEQRGGQRRVRPREGGAHEEAVEDRDHSPRGDSWGGWRWSPACRGSWSGPRLCGWSWLWSCSWR